MVRIAVLVSGGGTNLQALIDAQSRGELKNGRIAAVLSSRPDAYALERAAKAGIPSCFRNWDRRGSSRRSARRRGTGPCIRLPGVRR